MKTIAIAALLLLADVRAHAGSVTLRWVPGSTVRVEQLIGDCDYAQQALSGTCVPTTNRTVTRARILGTDLGASYESDGRLIFLFGDTLEPAGTGNYFARDTIASSTSVDPDGALALDFFVEADSTPYFIRVPGVRMGAAEVPNAGIRLNGTTYIVMESGKDINAPDPLAGAYTVLTRFDETSRTFTVLRNISSMTNGRFLITSLRQSSGDVLMFGLGRYRASDVYLAIVPAATFATGEGTRYFSGMAGGQPTWSTSESQSVPVVTDNPLNTAPYTPSIGNVSVTYAEALDLWLMTFDGGAVSQDTRGVWFAYAAEPWGPWSRPQLIFNGLRDGALGKFIHDPRIVPNPPGDGLNGPTIGMNDPYKTPGAIYAPYMIERFTRVDGSKLSIDYIVSTWNPYTIVRMRSEFEIVSESSRRRAVRR